MTAILLVDDDDLQREVNRARLVSRDHDELVPSIRVLLMSGYTEHSQRHVGEIARGPGFIQKPFAPAALAKLVRELLHAGAPCAT